VRNRWICLREGHRVVESLCSQGYRVFPIIADSFANDGEFLRIFGDSHVREYRQLDNRIPTKTMRRGEAWTSGVPLASDNWKELLEIAVSNGFGAVTLTFHGVLTDSLRLEPAVLYPIKGVLHGQDCALVIKRIHEFNRRLVHAENGVGATVGDPLQINVGVTIGTHNCSRDCLSRYVRYFATLGVSVLRFNRFRDYGGVHPELALTSEQVKCLYRDLKWIHDTVPFPFQLAVSEDFGSSGIEVMGFPPHVGWCRAGRQLFGIVPEQPVVLEDGGRELRERIGTIAACVDAFKPTVGRLVRWTDRVTQSRQYTLDFFGDRIEELRRKRVSGAYRDGCFASELLVELPHDAVSQFDTLHRPPRLGGPVLVGCP